MKNLKKALKQSSFSIIYSVIVIILLWCALWFTSCKTLEHQPETMTIQGDSLNTEYQIKFDSVKIHTAYLSDKNDKMAIAMIEAKNISDECFNLVERTSIELDSLRIKCFTKNDTLIELLQIYTDKGKGKMLRTTIIDNNTIKMTESIKDLVVQVDPEILQAECDRCEKLGVLAQKLKTKKWQLRCLLMAFIGVGLFFAGKYSSVISSGFGIIKGIAKGLFT